MKYTLATCLLSVLLASASVASAQDDRNELPHGFQKDHLFTGGSLTLGFSGNSFQAGASPFFGYNIAPWIDAGVTVNYNYISFKNVNISDPQDRLRRSTYGGGAFMRVYPVSFIFIQAQPEHNFVRQKLLPGNGGPTVKSIDEANSLLLGAGYATGRYPGSGQPFFYISLLFDVLDQEFSPYTSSTGNIIPILRAGLQVPLFQGRRARSMW